MSAIHLVANNRHDWLMWRRDGIGGSDAAAVAGLSPYGNPWTVWADKRGLVPLDAEEPRWARAGRLLEPVVVEWFTEDTGLPVVDRQAMVVGEQEWLRATLDGRTFELGQEILSARPSAVVEVKTSNGFDGAWKDGVPEHIAIQAQHQMAADDAARAYVAVLLRGDTFLWFQVERDEAAISELLTVEEDFWRRNVLGGKPPDVDGSERTTRAIRAAFGRPEEGLSRELPAEADGLIRAYLRESLAEHAAKAAKQAAANRLEVLLGFAETGTIGGRPVVRWPLVRRKGYSVKATEYRKLTVVGGAEGDE